MCAENGVVDQRSKPLLFLDCTKCMHRTYHTLMIVSIVAQGEPLASLQQYDRTRCYVLLTRTRHSAAATLLRNERT